MMNVIYFFFYWNEVNFEKTMKYWSNKRKEIVGAKKEKKEGNRKTL
jgi:hypothetical protein